MAQWVKDPALSLLWLGFDPWPRKFHMPWALPNLSFDFAYVQIYFFFDSQVYQYFLLLNMD